MEDVSRVQDYLWNAGYINHQKTVLTLQKNLPE